MMSSSLTVSGRKRDMKNIKLLYESQVYSSSNCAYTNQNVTYVITILYCNNIDTCVLFNMNQAYVEFKFNVVHLSFRF